MTYNTLQFYNSVSGISACETDIGG
jgi:hypothetical protein